MGLRVEIVKDITGEHYVLVIGNVRKMLSDSELVKMKKIAGSTEQTDASVNLLNYFKRERLDIIREAELDDPKRGKLICGAVVQILKQYF